MTAEQRAVWRRLADAVPATRRALHAVPTWDSPEYQQAFYDLEQARHDWNAAAREAVPVLLDSIDQVLTLHTARGFDGIEQTWCAHCGHPMPCPTVRAIEGAS